MKYFILGIAALATTACVTVRPVAAPASFIPQRAPEFVWVQQHDGELYQVARPTVRGDTLLGMRSGTSEQVKLMLPEIRSVSAPQLHRTRTTLLIATAAALAGFVVWRSTQSAGSDRYCFITPGGEFHCTN